MFGEELVQQPPTMDPCTGPVGSPLLPFQTALDPTPPGPAGPGSQPAPMSLCWDPKSLKDSSHFLPFSQ